MNLRQQITQAENHKSIKGKALPDPAWYLQPETVQESAALETETLSLPSAAQQALFDPTAAERILARAGALQEMQGQMLSCEEIEAIADEIGIKLEFVQLAIEQESQVSPFETGPVSHHQATVFAGTEKITPLHRLFNVAASVGAIVLYGILATLFLLMHHGPYPAPATFLWFVFLLPTLMALTLGNNAGSRRWGAGYGAMLGAVVIAALAASLSPDLDGSLLTAWNIQIFTAMSATGAVLGALGAQGRRVISRRRAKKRRGRARGPVR